MQSRVQPLKMSGDFDYDVIIVGCGVGGHGAALHAKSQGLKTCVLAGGDVGGTCVNRGCVPSKALLAAAGRVRDMNDLVRFRIAQLSLTCCFRTHKYQPSLLIYFAIGAPQVAWHHVIRRDL